MKINEFSGDIIFSKQELIDAAIKNLRNSIGTACVSASTLKRMTMEREKKKEE